MQPAATCFCNHCLQLPGTKHRLHVRFGPKGLQFLYWVFTKFRWKVLVQEFVPHGNNWRKEIRGNHATRCNLFATEKKICLGTPFAGSTGAIRTTKYQSAMSASVSVSSHNNFNTNGIVLSVQMELYWVKKNLCWHSWHLSPPSHEETDLLVFSQGFHKVLAQQKEVFWYLMRLDHMCIETEYWTLGTKTVSWCMSNVTDTAPWSRCAQCMMKSGVRDSSSRSLWLYGAW